MNETCEKEPCEKEKYETPVVEIIPIDAEDIIFASGDTCTCTAAPAETGDY